MSEDKNRRLWGTMPEKKFEQIEKWADELGVPTATFVALATWVGGKYMAEMLDLSKFEKEEEE